MGKMKEIFLEIKESEEYKNANNARREQMLEDWHLTDKFKKYAGSKRFNGKRPKSRR